MEPIWIYMPLVTALSGVLYQGHVTAALIITAFTSTSGRPSAMESLQQTAGQSCPPNCPHINIKATPITSTFKFLGCILGSGSSKIELLLFFLNIFRNHQRSSKRFMSKKQGQGLFPLAGIGTCICHLKRKDLTGSHRYKVYVVEIPDRNIYSCNLMGNLPEE